MNIEQIDIEALSFDYKNPRIAEWDLAADSDELAVIKILWDAMDVRELVLSITASGFFQHEPLMFVREGEKNVVIEGNRRLAAAKLLAHREMADELEIALPSASEEVIQSVQRLPCVHTTRTEAWRYLGFKHVNGPAKWGSFAKSLYIAEVHRGYQIELEDIAKQIGDTHRTVERLYRGLVVLEQAEKMKVFHRDDRWRTRFAFSHLYTGIGYSGISEFIGLVPDNDYDREPVPAGRAEELGQLMLWLYGSKSAGLPPVIERQNPHLRYLDAVVSNTEARAALRSGMHIEAAHELSRPSTNVFEEALVDSRQSLQKARGLMSVAYDGSEELLRIAGSVADLADDLYSEMERKYSGRGRTRLSGP